MPSPSKRTHQPGLFKHPILKYIKELELTSNANAIPCLRCNYQSGVSSYCAECVKPRAKGYKQADLTPWMQGERDAHEAARLAQALKLVINANGN